MDKTLRNRLVVVFGAILVFVAGIWIGGHPASLPKFASNALVQKTPGRTYDQALGLIKDEYFRKVDTNKLVDTAISASIASLHDPFSAYYDPKTYSSIKAASSGKYQGIGVIADPVKTGLKIIRVLPNSPAKKAKLQSGDVITVVNGHSISGKAAFKADSLIRGKAGTTDSLIVIGPNGEKRALKIKRAEISTPIVTSSMKIVNGTKVGYVHLAVFDPGAAAQVRDAVQKLLDRGAKGIVLDLRNNPGGLIPEAIGVASVFIPSGTIVTTKGRTVGSHVYKATGDAIKSNVPVVVLVNSNSASSAEIVTGALQDDHRAVVVGQHTFGKGVFQELQSLPNGGALEIVAGEYFTPKGKNLGGGGVRKGAGIKPNIVVINKSSTDDQLSAALSAAASKAK